MALSVSGFPEPSRHASAPSEVFTGDGGGGVQDAGFGKAGLMNSPRLRGLFGASSSSGVGSSSSKRPDTRNPPTTSKQDAEGSGGLGISGATEEASQSSSATATTPPTTPSLSFSTSSFEPLPQAEYELELQLPPMAALPPLDIPRPSGSKRPGLPPLPSRKTTQSPVRLGPNLSRLDIAASWARSPPTLHQPHPKALPPSVVVQEWKGGNSANNASLSTSPPQQPRPLPSVPANTVDSAKVVLNAVAGPSKHANAISATTVPGVGPSSRHTANAVAGSSKHVNAVAGSSKQANAVAGPSKQANAAAGSSKHPDALTITPAPPTATTSSTSSSTSSSPPTSKVIITQTTAQSQQTHKNTTSLSMRYQPLVAEPQAECSNSAAATTSGSSSKNHSSDAATTATNQSNSVMISSPVRPLPRIPPTTTAISTSVSAASSSSSGSSTSTSNLHPEQSTAVPSGTTPTPRVKRPKTSPSPITGFALPSPGPSSGLSSGNNGKSAASATTTTSSSSIITASTASSGGMSSSFSRSPFDTITTGHLNLNGSKVLPARAHPNAQQHAHAHARRANSPPLPVGGGMKLLPPRARSHSRPRRDRSLDSFYAHSTSTSKPPSRVSSPIMAAAGFGINNFPSPSPGSNGGVNGVSSPTGARSPRSLPSPTSTMIGGARPIPKKSGTLSHHHHHNHHNTNKTALHIQTSTTSLAAFGSSSLPSKSFAAGSSHGGSTWVVTSPSGRRSQPPSPPTGPVKPRSNTMAAGTGMTLHAPVASLRVLPKILVDAAPVQPVPVGPAVSVSTAVASSPSSLSSTSVGGAGSSSSSSGKGKEVAGASGMILDLHSILETQSIDSGMHNHPIEALSDDSEAPPVESASAPLDEAPPFSPVVGTPTADSSESPIEAYIYDPDQDMSLSRSPSPIRYARPESAGLFLSDTDLEEEITYAPGPSAYDSETSSAVSSRASSVDGLGLGAGGLGAGGLGGGGGTGGGGGRRRRRTQQLRSYRNSYRPRSGRSSPPYIPYERPSSPAREVVQPTVPVGTVEGKRDSKSKKKKARSYFGGGSGGGNGGLSTPGTRASSPERKSRSRQPRRLAEAVSTALEEVRNRGRGGSSSPKRKGKADGNSSSSNNLLVPGGGAGSQMEMEVLDISLPSLTRRETDGTIDTRSSVSDSQNASLNPSQVQIYTTTSTGNATSSARSSAKVGWAKVMGRKKSEIGDASSSASGSAAQLNVEQEVSWTETWTTSQGSKPSKSTHRRVGSLGAREDDADPMANADEEDDTYKTPGITLSKIETTITSTVTVTRPPSSSVSTPFSGFSITGKSKNKDKDKKRRAMSVTTPSTGSTTDGFGDKPRLIVHKTYEGHEGGHDVGGWVDLRNADDDEDEEDELNKDGVRVRRGAKRWSGGARRVSLDEGEVVVVTTKRVKREVDVDGELWDHEQETGMADVIQDLRSLKASRG